VHAAGVISPPFFVLHLPHQAGHATRNRVAQLITAKSTKLNVGAQIRLKLTAQK
jgi:hypothetical protein